METRLVALPGGFSGLGVSDDRARSFFAPRLEGFRHDGRNGGIVFDELKSKSLTGM